MRLHSVLYTLPTQFHCAHPPGPYSSTAPCTKGTSLSLQIHTAQLLCAPKARYSTGRSTGPCTKRTSLNLQIHTDQLLRAPKARYSTGRSTGNSTGPCTERTSLNLQVHTDQLLRAPKARYSTRRSTYSSTGPCTERTSLTLQIHTDQQLRAPRERRSLDHWAWGRAVLGVLLQCHSTGQTARYLVGPGTGRCHMKRRHRVFGKKEGTRLAKAEQALTQKTV